MKYFTKNAVCDKCGVKKSEFKTSILFQQHYNDHFDLQLSCNECSKKFPTKIKLSRHVGTVHKAGKSCEVCNKPFSTQSNLNTHTKNFIQR